MVTPQGEVRPGDPTPRQLASETLAFAARLTLVAIPVVALVPLTGSRLPVALIAGFVVAVMAISFPGSMSTRFLGAALVLTPDLVTVTTLSGSPVTARTCVFLLLELAVLLAVFRDRLMLRVPAPVLVLVLAFAGVVGAGANYRTKSIPEFCVVVLFPCIVGATLSSDRRVARDLLVGVTAGALLSCAIGLAESARNHVFLLSDTSPYFDTFVRGGHVRAAAGWAFPTEFSAFLCLAGFFVVDTFRARWGTFGMILGGVLITATVLATQSRSGLAGLVAGALVYLLFQRRLSNGLRVLAGLAAAVGLLFALPGTVPSSFQKFVEQSLTPGSGANANVSYRQQLYSAATTALSHKPFFGYGYGSGKSVATNGLAQYFRDLTDLASLPVSVAIQLGYVGALAFALFLLGAVIRLARSPDAMARLPLSAGIVACAVAMAGVPLSSPSSVMLLLAGMGWQLTSPVRASDIEASQRPDVRRPGALPMSTNAATGDVT